MKTITYHTSDHEFCTDKCPFEDCQIGSLRCKYECPHIIAFDDDWNIVVCAYDHKKILPVQV